MDYSFGNRAFWPSEVVLWSHPQSRPRIGDIVLLTEQEVARSWRGLFANQEITVESMDKGEALLTELRAESPLRHRLDSELEELRKLHSEKV